MIMLCLSVFDPQESLQIEEAIEFLHDFSERTTGPERFSSISPFSYPSQLPLTFPMEFRSPFLVNK